MNTKTLTPQEVLENYLREAENKVREQVKSDIKHSMEEVIKEYFFSAHERQ